MPVTLSSKGKDFEAWRSAEEFAVTCRQMLLSKTDMLLSDQAEALFAAADRYLAEKAAAHEANLANLRNLMDQAGQTTVPRDLKQLLTDFYTNAYDFFGQNRSSVAFYTLSNSFLRAVCAAIVGHAKKELGLSADKLPPITLVVLGSGGRLEFSPFSRLPLLMVHGETDASGTVPLRLFGKILHEAFEEAGLFPDDVVTPRNPAWNSTMAFWRHGLEQKIRQGTLKEIIDLLKLADQTVIHDEGLGMEFREHCLTLLKSSHTSLDLMVKRLLELPRGLGIMGGLKYEKRGVCQGYFNLFSHALLPLTAAVTALALLKGVAQASTTDRIRGLLRRGDLNVEMAERLLETWHLFNEMRLDQEASLRPDWERKNVLCLDTEDWDKSFFDRFKESLETVSTLHRQVGIAFNTFLEAV
ncbi:putative nucleotidyltransferase substrate binding domain-containing protein [Pelotalea chapellei]|uniref:Nucleotidyltransferase DUF294 n=1 Tax=Pelotalea chapellei TaxID=44671 RepID=A0ABS5UBV1_9BACT|nr:putative nucleotidyltransferase substrate binding domain-containing protein [Pelotalea chapellei]MBT1073160.1 hypothetical protein [Pelotalea chapellei]